MIRASAFRIGQVVLIAFVAVVFAPAPENDGSSAQGITRSERSASEPVTLAQRCVVYKGELKCF